MSVPRIEQFARFLQDDLYKFANGKLGAAEDA